MKNAALLVLSCTLIALGLWISQSPNAALPNQESIQGTTARTWTPEEASASAVVTRSNHSTPAVVEPNSFSALPGTISGVVVDSQGMPIPGMRCSLARGPAPTGLGSIAPTPKRESIPVASLYSDEQGTFRFSVEEGWWSVTIEGDGFAPWQENNLKAGDFRWIRLAPAQSLLVLVEDDDGNPIADAKVQLAKGEFNAPEAYAHQTSSTNAAGRADFPAVPAENWFVSVTHREFFSKRVKLDFPKTKGDPFLVVLERGIRIIGTVTVSDQHIPAALATVRFESLEGATANHEVSCDGQGNYSSQLAFMPGLFLEATASSTGFGELRKKINFPFGNIPDGGAIRMDFNLTDNGRSAFGRVVDIKGKPLAEVQVFSKALLALPKKRTIQIPSAEILAANGNPNFSALDPSSSMVATFSYKTKTDNEGYFLIQGLQATQPYKILLASEQYSNSLLWCYPGEPGESVDLGLTTLQRGGRVWGYVRRPDGNPIEGIRVSSVNLNLIKVDVQPNTIYHAPLPTVEKAMLESITNQDGYFLMEPFPAGDFYLKCERELLGPFNLEAGGEIGSVEFTVQPENQRTQNRITVKLQVLDSGGEAVKQAYGQLIQVDPDSDSNAPLTPTSWTSGFGNSVGELKLSTYQQGTYDVIVKDFTGQLLETVFRVELDSAGLQRTVHLSHDLNPAGNLNGVVQTLSGAPISGLKVTLEPKTGYLSCNCFDFDEITDEWGSFSFGKILKGNHRLLISDPEERFHPTVFYPAIAGEPLIITIEE